GQADADGSKELPEPVQLAEPETASEPIDPRPEPEPMVAAGDEDDVSRDDDEGPVHRPLIRASLPRPEGQQPPARPIPEFTIRQPGGRPNRFRPRHQRGGASFSGNNRSNGGFGGPMRGNTRPQGVPSRTAKRQHEFGGLDSLVHGAAFAPADALSHPFVETSRESFRVALDVSVYSLVALTRAVVPLMEPRGGGSILTLTYIGSQRVFPNYN